MTIAPQVILNCKAGGTCQGGNPIQVYAFAHTRGVSEETCQNYVAKNPEAYTCSDIQRCGNCAQPKGEKPGATGNCWAQKSYPIWKVTEYGAISGADKMKA